MRRALVLASVVLVAACGGEPAARPGLTPATGPANPAPPADIAVDRDDRLVALDGARAAGRGVRLRGHLSSWAASPDGTRIALGVARVGRLQLVDLPPRRPGRLVETEAGTPIAAVAWPTADRVLAASGWEPGSQSVLIDLDPRRGEVRDTRVLPGAVLAAHGGRLGLTAVLGPAGRLGEARLVHAGPDGRLRTWRLPGVGAGEAHETVRGLFVARLRTPGLAVAEADARAYVVAPGRALRVVEVDLRSGRRAVHLAQARRGPVAWLRDGVLAEAHAKRTDTELRQAHWLGGGVLAVAGVDERPRHGVVTAQPFGLHLVDVRSWRRRSIDRRAGWLLPAGDLVVASDGVLQPPYGVRFDGPRASRDGVRAYGADGRRRWAVGAGRSLTARYVLGGRLEVLDWRARRLVAVDLDTGHLGVPRPPGRVPTALP